MKHFCDQCQKDVYTVEVVFDAPVVAIEGAPQSIFAYVCPQCGSTLDVDTW